MDDEMKERPKFGDNFEFRAYGHARTGTVTAVAETGMHFLIKAPEFMYKYKRIGLNDIILILPEMSSEVKSPRTVYEEARTQSWKVLQEALAQARKVLEEAEDR